MKYPQNTRPNPRRRLCAACVATLDATARPTSEAGACDECGVDARPLHVVTWEPSASLRAIRAGCDLWIAGARTFRLGHGPESVEVGEQMMTAGAEMVLAAVNRSGGRSG